MSCCAFVPPYLLETLAHRTRDDHVLGCARNTLEVDDAIRSRRRFAGVRAAPDGGVPTGDVRTGGGRTVRDAEHTSELPGRVVRREGEPATGDAATDEAYDGMGATRSLFAEVFDRDSLDGQGHPLDATVHYQRDYANAFWEGRRLVFGDGDGTIFERFTKPVGVIAHEFVHGVTQFTAGLVYESQSGSLNESMSDVFAALTIQRLRGQSVDEASWLIGEGLFRSGVNARALRSMAQPGTAYDDPQLGRDPQPATMTDFVETTDDNGGVHINSGIPNRAFYLVATALGGSAWEQAGQIWYAALTDARLRSTADFATFADLTVTLASEMYGADSAERQAVIDAWRGVEVLGSHVVVVRRTGGFAGLVTERRLDTRAHHGGDVSRLLDQLLDRVDLRAVRSSPPHPDAYVFSIVVDDSEVTVQERDLGGELARLVDLVLDEGEIADGG